MCLVGVVGGKCVCVTGLGERCACEVLSYNRESKGLIKQQLLSPESGSRPRSTQVS